MTLRLLLWLLIGAFSLFGILESLADTPPRGYYLISEKTLAEDDAQQHHIPLIWMSSDIQYLTENRSDDPAYDLSQMAMSYLSQQLKGKVVLLIFYNNREIGQVPDIVHAQIHIIDDPGLPSGTNYVIPKMVFTSGDVTQVFGRLSQTQMAAGRERAIYDVVKMIYTKSEFRAKLKEDAVPAEGLAVNQKASSVSPSKAAFSFFSSKGLSLILLIGLIGGVVGYSQMQTLKKAPVKKPVK